jgi:hypothetical protein
MNIFGPKRKEVMEVWRKLHNEQVHDLHSSPIIISVIKRRMMICSMTFSGYSRVTWMKSEYTTVSTTICVLVITGASGTYGREEKRIQDFGGGGGGKLNESDQLARPKCRQRY